MNTFSKNWLNLAHGERILLSEKKVTEALKYLKFAVSRIHHKHDSIHSEGSLSNVCSNNAFPYTIRGLAESKTKAVGRDSALFSHLCSLEALLSCKV